MAKKPPAIDGGFSTCSGCFLSGPAAGTTNDAFQVARFQADTWRRQNVSSRRAAPGTSIGHALSLQVYRLTEQVEIGLCLLSPHPGSFTPQTTARLDSLYEASRRPLAIGVRLTAAAEQRDNLALASASRTRINLAAGILVTQNGCSQEQAIDILRTAASNRNMKMSVLVELIISSTKGPTANR